MKLKAKEGNKLFNKYYALNEQTDTCFGICEDQPISVCDHTGNGCGLWKQHAKQSTIIAIDEIITVLKEGEGECTLIHIVHYWQDVKKEIEEL